MEQYQHQSSMPSYQQPQYQPDDPCDRKVKRPFWTYFLTALIASAVTFALCVGLFFGWTHLFTEQLIGAKPVRKSQAKTSLTEGQQPTGDQLTLSFENTPENQTALAKLQKIFQDLKSEYYKELTDAQLIEAMATGMVGQMDSKFTYYMSKEYNQQVRESMSGEYSGIGAIVQKVGTGYEIGDLIDGSPAEKSGLRVNDVFVSVNGVKADQFEDVSMLASKVRGEEGTVVELVMFRPSDNRELTFSVERKKITNANIRSKMISDEIGYVRILEFNSGVSHNFITAMDELQAKGAKKIVFDLRGNGGGYVHEVLAMLDYLLPEGEIIRERGRSNGEPFEDVAKSDAHMGVPEDMTYTIIMNKYSASASELFAGCLRDWKKATLVGTQSFGKGVGTISRDLDDGSAINITNFYYYLPNGDNVQDVGLTPDYPVELPDDMRGYSVSQLDPKKDTQLQKAIELLEEQIKNGK